MYLIKVQVELDLLENRMQNLNDMKRPLQVRINSLLNIPIEVELLKSSPEFIKNINKEKYFQYEYLVEKLKENNPV